MNSLLILCILKYRRGLILSLGEPVAAVANIYLPLYAYNYLNRLKEMSVIFLSVALTFFRVLVTPNEGRYADMKTKFPLQWSALDSCVSLARLVICFLTSQLSAS